MRIFIDESGSFQIPPSSDEHAAGVVVGVVVPEVCERRLFDKFAELCGTLDPLEVKGSEPKGSRFSQESRNRFCDLLAEDSGVMLIPTTVDLSDLVGHGPQLPLELSETIHERAKKCVHKTMRDEMMLLSQRVANLSVTDLLKLLMYTECIQECVHHAVAYLSEEPYRDCWSSVEIVIDRVNAKPDSREKLVYEFMLLSWLTAWSERRPLMLIKEIHTKDHPFVKRYDTGTGIDVRRLYGDGLRWEDSESQPGIQIADVAAAIVFDAVHDLKNHNNRLPVFVSLMRSCPFPAQDGPGFVTLLPEGEAAQLEKYQGLVLALGSKSPDRRGSFKGLRHPPAYALPEPGSRPGSKRFP